MEKKPELLAPAGDLERLKIAVLYGADAVYVGGEEFSMRTACDNFSQAELQEGIDFAKARGKKVYVAGNVIMRNNDLDTLYTFARDIAAQGADAIILSDLGAFSVVREAAPKLDIHISTQANITNYQSAKAWHTMGATRVVLARELSGQEVAEVRANTPQSLELEVFVHGAMCVSYSGRCLLSNYLTGRDANKGDCAQACRWKYYLMEEKRPGEYMPITENDRGSFVFNAKDLCLLEYLPQLVESGVSSLKIEGRVKSEFYVATVVKTYRRELDRYLENPESYKVSESALAELCKVSHRQYTTGFWTGEARQSGQIYESSSYIRDYQVVGMVEDCDENGNLCISQRNKFSVGETVEILRPDGDFLTHTITEMYDENGVSIESAPHATMRVCMKIPTKISRFSMIRKRL